ncbi:MAG: VWA domain-containing protein [bacterium]|nr:VWA domain-containing protein [bacterium]
MQAADIPRILLVAAAVATLLSAAPALRGQEPSDSAEPTEVFVDAVEVNVVNVEVYVTDRSGRRVTGLTKKDFELFEDNRPVAVTNFYAVEDGRPAPQPEQEAGTVEPRPEVTEAIRPDGEPPLDPRFGSPPLPENQRLHLVVYFDNLFLRPFNRNKVIRQVRRFLHDHVSPQDRVMLVTFERAMHVRHPFTSDMRAIGTAMYDLETLSGFAVQAESERREILQRIDRARDPFEAADHVDYHAKSVYNDMSSSITALKNLVGSLAGLPGRKAILYVSDGIPMTAAQDFFFLLDQKYSDRGIGRLRAGRYSGQRLYRELTARANANRVTFYTLEAVGLRSHSSLSAEYEGSGGKQLSDGSRAEVDFVRSSNFQEPLQVMALDTGGLASFNTSNFAGALDAMASDFQSYYSLGYTPGHSGDGRYHDIRVQVKRKGMEVRHRGGYRDKTSESRVADGTLAALLYGIESNPLALTIDIEPERPRDEGFYLVPMVVRIPLGNLALIPQGERHLGRVRISIAVIDVDGGMSPVEQTPIPISIPDSEIGTARTQFYTYAVELMMRRGYQKVAIGVRDEFAGENSFVRQPVRIGI